MVRHLEVRRHADADGDVLTPAGVAAAVRLGRDGLTGAPALAASSGAQRATQTIGCLLAGAGVAVPGGVVVVGSFRSDREDEWRAAYGEAGSGHLDDLRAVAPSLVAEDAEVLAGALREVLAALADGERALVVGHSPTSEAAVLGLTGEVVAPLGTGEGVLLAVEDASARVVRRLDG